MNALLRIGDKYAENSSWRDFAVVKFCLFSMGFPRTLREVGIGEEKLELMAENCAPGLARAFVPLTKEDVLEIFRDCLE